MLIRTQDGDTLVNLSSLVDLEICQEKDGCHILANYGDEYDVDMGIYSSRARCQKELGHIEIDFVANPNSIYHMPEDDRTWAGRRNF